MIGIFPAYLIGGCCGVMLGLFLLLIFLCFLTFIIYYGFMDTNLICHRISVFLRFISERCAASGKVVGFCGDTVTLDNIVSCV